MTLNGGKYACSGNRERGTCSNGKIIAAATVERRVVEGVRAKLLAPNKAVAQAIRDQAEAASAERKQILASRAPIERELAEIERKLTRAKDMYLNGVVDMPELESLASGLKARKAELEAKLALVETPSTVVPHPGLAEVYQQLSERLHEALDGEDSEEMRTELRDRIDRVDFQPLEGLGKFDLKVSGKLKALLVSKRASASSKCEVLVGAGTRSHRSDTWVPTLTLQA